MVDRAYLLSKHKEQFIAQEALAEANRYEAALFTAVQYNQPGKFVSVEIDDTIDKCRFHHQCGHWSK